MRGLMVAILSALSLHAATITVAAAANVSFAMDALKAAFEKSHPNDRLRVIIGSSGKLTAQIRNGAPYQIFMSADMGYPEALYKEGLTLTPPVVYARGTLALFTIRPHDFSQGLKLLLQPDIRRIAVANPRTAPYGRAAEEALKRSGLYNRLKPKFIYGESVSQTVAYAVTAADAGLIAASALYNPKMARFKKGRNWAPVNPKLYRPIDQGIVLLKKGGSRPEAKAFYDFILSPRAQAIFKRFGYLKP